MTLSMFVHASWAQALSTDTPQDPVSRATFSSDMRMKAPDFSGRRTAGGNLYTLKGIGVNFNQSFSQGRSFWSQLNHRPDDKIWPEVSSQGTLPFVDILEKSKFQVVAGVDQMLHPGQSRYWGFVVGLGLGLASSEYEIKKYRSLCTFICGYDPKNPAEERFLDQYAFLVGRLGLSFRQTVVAGLTGDITIGAYPQLLRTGEEPQFKAYDGSPIETKKFQDWVVEYSVEF